MANPIIARLAQLLHQIADGTLTVRVVGQSWHQTFAGDVVFAVSDGSNLTIFNDCDAFDYVDTVMFTDGQRGDFDDWPDGELDRLLSDDVQERLYNIFANAEPTEDAWYSPASARR